MELSKKTEKQKLIVKCIDDIEIEKIIRIIPIKDNDKFKNNKLELRVITINLSNIKDTEEHYYIKIFLKQVKQTLNICFLI